MGRARLRGAYLSVSKLVTSSPVPYKPSLPAEMIRNDLGLWGQMRPELALCLVAEYMLLLWMACVNVPGTTSAFPALKPRIFNRCGLSSRAIS